jgi:hypothetical protein
VANKWQAVAKILLNIQEKGLPGTFEVPDSPTAARWRASV